MIVRNARRMITEPYDPKQRIVGGIILFLLVLLLYIILKVMLSLFTVRESNYTLHEPLPDEVLAGQVGAEGNMSDHRTVQPNRRLPQGFIFLDLNGNPMQTETDSPTVTTEVTNAGGGGGGWVVQIASFKESNRAQNLVQQLKDKGMESEIVKVGNWYTVRLLPQTERRAAELQGRQVSNLHLPGIRQPLVKKID